MITNYSGQAGSQAAPSHMPRRPSSGPIRKAGSTLLSWLVLAGFLAACTSNYTRPLVSRGLPAEERKDYIIQNGFGIPENVKQAFLDGYVEVGMAREMVFQLYGSPDRTTGGDTNWEYVNNTGNLITGITFKADKVEKLYGDPRGGNTGEARVAN